MRVTQLALHDFRNYKEATVEFEEGPNVIFGRNGQGKTNLIEAVGYVSTLGSHRVAADLPLIRFGAPRAVIQARVVRGDRASVLEVEITKGMANRARINRGQPTRARDVLGVLRTVTFAPEDIALVKGEPEGRRRFLDQLLIQLLPRTAAVLAEYDKVVRQRSALLKSIRTSESTRYETANREQLLQVWDEKLAELGAEVVNLRLALVSELSGPVKETYDAISDLPGETELRYHQRGLVGTKGEEGGAPRGDVTQAELRQEMLAGLAISRVQEIERGQCLLGPHRDDLEVRLGGLPAKGYASHGESWSLALALRLASWRALGGSQRPPEGEPKAKPWPQAAEHSDPVLILDDVFAELDDQRRIRLADVVSPIEQVLITCATVHDLPLLPTAHQIEVAEGKVRLGG